MITFGDMDHDWYRTFPVSDVSLKKFGKAPRLKQIKWKALEDCDSLCALQFIFDTHKTAYFTSEDDVDAFKECVVDVDPEKEVRTI
jgi:hypothetical protein